MKASKETYKEGVLRVEREEEKERRHGCLCYCVFCEIYIYIPQMTSPNNGDYKRGLFVFGERTRHESGGAGWKVGVIKFHLWQ